MVFLNGFILGYEFLNTFVISGMTYRTKSICCVAFLLKNYFLIVFEEKIGNCFNLICELIKVTYFIIM